jgi:hypothetical protein
VRWNSERHRSCRLLRYASKGLIDSELGRRGFGYGTSLVVNLLITVPFISYVFWQRASISIRRTHLLAAALFAASFGVVEGTVVVYLRAVLGAAAGYSTSLSGVTQFSESLNQVKLEPTALPPSLLKRGIP